MAMKLILSIVHNDDANDVMTELRQKGYQSTKVSTTGGFLRAGNATILIGVEEDHVEDVLSTFQKCCHTRTQYINPLPPVMEPGELYMPSPVEVQVGGATVFILDIERMAKY